MAMAEEKLLSIAFDDDIVGVKECSASMVAKCSDRE
jgi:hypothetical protein